MADLMTTAVSALLAYRRGLDTTSHNIANVGTDGYTRQRTDYATREAQPYGNGWVGSGVQVSTVQRVYDEFLTLQWRSTTSGFARQESFAALAERVSSLFADTSSGLGTSLQSFVNALQGVANSPTSIPARQVLLSEASALAGQFSGYGTRLEQLTAETNGRITSGAQEVNGLASAIADLNQRIVTALGRTSQPPNDLLDQRDRLVDSLAQKVAVTTVRQDDGALNVFVGTGQPMVLGTMAATLVTRSDPYDPSSLQIAVQTRSGTVDITGSIGGGELGGFLDFRRQLLEPARNAIGQLAVGIAELVNSQQRAGMDLTGAAGADLFAVGAAQALGNSANTGTATVAVARTDLAQLTTANYYLEHAAGAWSLRRADTGAAVTMTGSGTSADPFRADGLSFTIAGTPASGDRYLIRPTQGAALGMQALVSDPARVAAALPVTAAVGSANTGSVIARDLTVVDASNPALRSTVTISFPTAGSYSVNGGAPQAYTAGAALEVNGWRLTLDGTPAAGDTLVVGSNVNGVGDNRNMLAMVDALARPSMNGGTASLNDLLGRVVADAGVQTRQAQLSRDALRIVQRDAQAARDSVTGVNLDEEAANLVRLQQAYQAAAQVVQVADATFQALLGAIRR